MAPQLRSEVNLNALHRARGISKVLQRGQVPYPESSRSFLPALPCRVNHREWRFVAEYQ